VILKHVLFLLGLKELIQKIKNLNFLHKKVIGLLKVGFMILNGLLQVILLLLLVMIQLYIFLLMRIKNQHILFQHNLILLKNYYGYQNIQLLLLVMILLQFVSQIKHQIQFGNVLVKQNQIIHHKLLHNQLHKLQKEEV